MKLYLSIEKPSNDDFRYHTWWQKFVQDLDDPLYYDIDHYLAKWKAIPIYKHKMHLVGIEFETEADMSLFLLRWS